MSDYKKTSKNARLEAGKLMTSRQVKACNGIIHTASAACGACGAIPIPIADAIPMTAAQITMVISLGKVFEIKVTESVAKTILAGVAAPLVGRAAAGAALKFIPVAGWIASAAVAAGVTEAIGWVIANDFARQFKTNYFEEQKKQSDEELERERKKSKSSIFDEDDDDAEAADPGKFL